MDLLQNTLKKEFFQALAYLDRLARIYVALVRASALPRLKVKP
jgi:hypothetical protein